MTKKIATITAAMKEIKLLRITYLDSKKQVSIREVEPYEIKDNSLYAFCHIRQSIRRFKLETISKTVVLNKKFIPRYPIKLPEGV